ncbi:MAG: hypothetical protein JST90_12000 [Bacteroidetes bacterium]|nr:hypothetical protein [Bacteroidota bacterium]
MRLSIIVGVLMSVMLMSCSKTDNTTNWVGIYTGSAGSVINRVLVTKVDNSTVKMELQTQVSGTYYTYVTMYNVKISSSTTANVNENGAILGYTDTYHFVGTGALSGTTLTLAGSGTSTTNSSDVKYYAFTGSR